MCHVKDSSPVGASSSGTTCSCQIHKQADALTVGTANPGHQLMLLPACLPACCRKACVMMNELPSMKRKAPLFKVTALSELSHFGELPSYPSRRAGHTCPCTLTYPHTLICTFADDLPGSSDPTHLYSLKHLWAQMCSHIDCRLALVVGNGQTSGVLAERHQIDLWGGGGGSNLP